MERNDRIDEFCCNQALTRIDNSIWYLEQQKILKLKAKN